MRLFIFGVIVFHISFSCFSKEQINWLSANFPPVMELNDQEVPVGGYVKKQMDIIFQEMEGFEHTYIKMTWARAWASIKSGYPVCHTMAAKTPEREQYAYFSIPKEVTTLNAIIMSRDMAKRLSYPQSISLSQLLQNGEFKGVLQNERSYLPFIDKLLATYEKRVRIERVATRSHQLLQMLSRKRIDYFIDFPAVIGFSAKKYDINEEQFFISRIEGAPSYDFSYFACPKNEWGKKIINRLNQIIKQYAPTTIWLNIYKESLPRRYRPYIEKVYREEYVPLVLSN